MNEDWIDDINKRNADPLYREGYRIGYDHGEMQGRLDAYKIDDEIKRQKRRLAVSIIALLFAIASLATQVLLQ